jgi:hypothetical protein
MAKKRKKDKATEQVAFTTPGSENAMPSEEKKSGKKSKRS